MRKLLFFIAVFAALLKSQTLTVFNQRGDSTTAGQIDTSPTIDLYSDVANVNGLLTVHVAIDSFIDTDVAAIFADDSIVVWMDRYIAGNWEPSDSMSFYNPGLDTFAAAFTIITSTSRAVPIVGWFNPTPSSITPTSITHLSCQFVRFRKKSINTGKHHFKLDLIAY